MEPKIRPLLPQDRSSLEELDRATLEKALPEEWEAWADEPHRVLVCELEGKVFGAVHVAMVGPTEGWVEGVRVLPEFRGRGYGRRLVEEGVRVCASYGALVVHAMVPADREGLGFAEHLGFREAARFDVWRAQLDPAERPTGVAPVRPREVGQVAYWLRPEIGQRSAGLVPLGWRFRTLRDEILGGAAREERLWASVDPRGAVLFLRARADRVIDLLVGSDPGPLVAAVRADMRVPALAGAFVPSGSVESRWLASQGFHGHPWCPQGLVVLSRPVR